MEATHTSTNPFQHAKSVMGDIVEENMAGVHLEECVSGFGPQKSVECVGLSGEEGERRRGAFGILKSGELRGFGAGETEKKREKKRG